MRITIINTYARGATINRIVSLINVLGEHDVHVVGQAGEDFLKLSILQNKNVTIHHIPLSQSKSKSFLLRYLDEFRYGLKCSKKAKRLKSDYELMTVPFISLIITSRLIRGKAKQILDVRDIQWEYLKEASLVSKIIKKVLKEVHLFFLRKYDLITLTNPYEMRILERDISKNKKALISNGITQVQFNKIQEGLKDRQQTEANPFVITYVGNVGIAQNLGTFIETIKDFEQFELVIVGDGNDLARLTELIETQGIKNVRLVGRVGVDEVFDYYNNSDFLWAKLDPNYLSAVPSKLYEYLATGKPLIYSGKGAAVELLENFEKVYIVEDTPADLTQLMNHLKGLTFPLNCVDKNIDLIRRDYIRENINKTLLKYFSDAE